MKSSQYHTHLSFIPLLSVPITADETTKLQISDEINRG
jgi:hypothetical protein